MSDAPPRDEAPTTPALEIAHVLFMDIVGYSTLPMEQQTRSLNDLQEIVRETTEFKRNQKHRQLLRLPTGDGMALVFFGDPEASVRCAIEIAGALSKHPEIKLRMGIHTGPVHRIQDINAARNVSGGGINIAQRVMDCGDAGHILLSSAVAEVLRQVRPTWSASLHDFGETDVKHGVKAVDCSSGEALAQEQVQAGAKEGVLKALGKGATSLREKLGESLSTVQKFDTPLEQVSTSSLEALKAFSLGEKVLNTTGDAASMTFFERAVELDPNFALAYVHLALATTTIGEPSRGAEYTRKAYELRDRTSEPERYFITVTYQKELLGNFQKAEETCKLWIAAYPRADMPHGYLSGAIYPVFGRYDKMVEEAREAIVLNPAFPIAHAFLMFGFMGLNRIDDAKAEYRQSLDRKLDNALFPLALYQIAFLQKDAAGMAKQVAWSTGQPGSEDVFLALEADTAAYSGRLTSARELSRRAIDSAGRARANEGAATYAAQSGLREALFGNAAEAKRQATLATQRPPSRDAEFGAAMAFAYAKDAARTAALTEDLMKRFPEDTVVQFYYLPTLRAKLAVSRGNASEAIETLRTAAPYELGQSTSSAYGWNGLYSIFVRGEAYLAGHQGNEAAAEFQKILDHSGIVINQPIGALAHLGIARARVLQGDSVGAKGAYQDFLALWKDADPEIPILTVAKAEYAKLR